MDDSAQSRLCDGLTGAAIACSIAAAVADAFPWLLVTLGVAVSAQLLRSSIGS